jgi:hypothetical protein
MMEITENEKQIIQFIREAKPYEKIEIQKDKDGKPDYFIIKREQKVFFSKQILIN